ncbi:hypothetical protein BDN67DRAFT_915212, partial [Paxillus ammoniavirescens]
AKSITKKKQDACNAHNGLMSSAVKAYLSELGKAPRLQQQGARTICRDFEEMNLQATGKWVQLSYSTLLRLAAGGKSLAKINAAKSWLTAEETEQVIASIVELRNRGFPLSHRRLREHVDEICYAKL